MLQRFITCFFACKHHQAAASLDRPNCEYAWAWYPPAISENGAVHPQCFGRMWKNWHWEFSLIFAGENMWKSSFPADVWYLTQCMDMGKNRLSPLIPLINPEEDTSHQAASNTQEVNTCPGMMIWEVLVTECVRIVLHLQLWWICCSGLLWICCSFKTVWNAR